MPILIWIGRSSGMLLLATFPNSTGGFSRSSQRSFRILESTEARGSACEVAGLGSNCQPRLFRLNDDVMERSFAARVRRVIGQPIRGSQVIADFGEVAGQVLFTSI